MHTSAHVRTALSAVYLALEAGSWTACLGHQGRPQSLWSWVFCRWPHQTSGITPCPHGSAQHVDLNNMYSTACRADLACRGSCRMTKSALEFTEDVHVQVAVSSACTDCKQSIAMKGQLYMLKRRACQHKLKSGCKRHHKLCQQLKCLDPQAACKLKSYIHGRLPEDLAEACKAGDASGSVAACGHHEWSPSDHACPPDCAALPSCTPSTPCPS